MILVLDETAVADTLRRQPPERPDLVSRNRAMLPAYQRSTRLEAFLNAAAGSPPSTQWSSTVGADNLDAEEGFASTSPNSIVRQGALQCPSNHPLWRQLAMSTSATDSGTEALVASVSLDSSNESIADVTSTQDALLRITNSTGEAAVWHAFQHQRRTAVWMYRVESEIGASLRIKPLSFAGREFGYEYHVSLPSGGCIAHPPGAGKTLAASLLLSCNRRPTLVVCPAHLQPHWEETLVRVGCTVLVGLQDDERNTRNLADRVENLVMSVVAALHRGDSSVILLVSMDHIDPIAAALDVSAVAATDKCTRTACGRRVGVKDDEINVSEWRILVDEPQDVPSSSHRALYSLISHFRYRWLICGTASAHLQFLGALLLGPRCWRQAMTSHEWAKRPSVAHVLRCRFLRDPSHHCLPLPPLELIDVPVVPSQDEALSAQLAALSGYMIDSLLFLSFGPQAAVCAERERRRVATSARYASRRRINFTEIASFWPETVGAEEQNRASQGQVARVEGDEQCTRLEGLSLVSEEESSEEDEEDAGADGGFRSLGHFLLNNWHSVEARCRQRLAKAERRLARVRAELRVQQHRYQMFSASHGGAHQVGGVLERLAFLSDSDLVQLDLQLGETSKWEEALSSNELAAAEWNAAIAETEMAEAVRAGPLVVGLADEALERADATASSSLPLNAVVLCAAPADGDYCSLAWRASAAGAVALLVASPTSVATPMAYASSAVAPPIPAAMLPTAAAARVAALVREQRGGSSVRARLSIFCSQLNEDHEGMMAEVVALNDALDPLALQRAEALEAEAAQLRRGLRFAAQVRENLFGGSTLAEHDGAAITEKDAARAEATTCPVCLESRETICVLPNCFHILCQPCLQAATGGASTFTCPLCRVSVDAWSVCVFRMGQRQLPERASKGGFVAQAEAIAQEDVNIGPTAVTIAAASTMPSIVHLPTVTWDGLPRKLQALLSLLGWLLGQPGEERVLVFTQWVAHVRHLADLFQAAAVPALAMAGSLAQSMHALASFGKPGQPRVLILSSQYHASGINLQAARNVIILHPFCTPTATSPDSVLYSDLVSYESQAIGRVRRWPQAHVVRVYRLFAEHSVEHGMYSNSQSLRNCTSEGGR
eukprot:scaffold247498_cov31-Tisochrysis_lutea.AAC.2